MCILSLPCLLRHKHPLIKAVIFLPTDDTLAHVKEVGAGGRGIWGASGSSQNDVCVSICVHVFLCPLHAINSSELNTNGCLLESECWAMTAALCFHRGYSLSYEKISRNDRQMEVLENRQLELQLFWEFPRSMALWSPPSIWHLISLAVKRSEYRKQSEGISETYSSGYLDLLELRFGSFLSC